MYILFVLLQGSIYLFFSWYKSLLNAARCWMYVCMYEYIYIYIHTYIYIYIYIHLFTYPYFEICWREPIRHLFWSSTQWCSKRTKSTPESLILQVPSNIFVDSESRSWSGVPGGQVSVWIRLVALNPNIDVHMHLFIMFHSSGPSNEGRYHSFRGINLECLL